MINEKQPLLLGAHISTAGGYHKAIERGLSIGCTTIQIFTKSNRQWAAKAITPEEIEYFKLARAQSTIQSITAHAAYLINIGSQNPATEKRSLDALIHELERCEQLGIEYLVLHPGSSAGMPLEESLFNIAINIDKALAAVPGKTMLLLETMAGQGSTLCYTFEQLATVFKQIKSSDRVGICFDTCHAFVAGYDISTKETYEKVWESFDRFLGLEKIKLFHINDSKKECGSRVDRHEHIGKGTLGLEAFRLLFNDARFKNIPKILETPKEGLLDDWRNMHTIKKLISDENQKQMRIYIPENFIEAKSK